MGRLVFLLEEQSMKELLDGLLPRLFPGLNFLCVPHEGKQDLERSISRKLRAWRVPGDRFVIVRDNDNQDCVALKDRLRQFCQGSGHDDALVRIVCQELEAWYLGQPDAMADAFGNENLRYIGDLPRYRNPDARPSPSKDVEKLCKGFQKIDGARRIADYLTREGNRSPSFNIFLSGVANLILRPVDDQSEGHPS